TSTERVGRSGVVGGLRQAVFFDPLAADESKAGVPGARAVAPEPLCEAEHDAGAGGDPDDVRGYHHRSIHSTNAGGTSLRTTMTRRTRSSRSKSAAPVLAASMTPYRAHAAGIPEDDPRRIVAISLNTL